MERKPTIYAVVAVYNRKHYTEKCLGQLGRQTYPNLRIVVVDDGSTDGTAEMLAERFPEVAVVRGPGDWFWTGSMYHGIEHVLRLAGKDDCILVVNDDLIFDDHFVEALYEVACDHPAALIHALNCFNDDRETIAFGGKSINWWTNKGVRINRGRNRLEFPAGHCEKTSVMWGRGLLLPVKVVHDIGNYDTSYVQHGDPEFGRRAAKAGYDLLVAYDVVAYMYCEKTPDINEQEEYSLTQFKRYFFDVCSGGCLRTLYLNAMKMTRSKLQAWVFLVFGLCRYFWHFFSRVRRFK